MSAFKRFRNSIITRTTIDGTMTNVNYTPFSFALCLISWNRARRNIPAAWMRDNHETTLTWSILRFGTGVVLTSRRFRPTPSIPICVQVARYSRVLTAWTYYADPLRSCPVRSVHLQWQFAIPEGTADLIKSHGSGPTPIYGVCLIVHNERSNIPFSPSATQGFHDSVSMPRVRACALKGTDLLASKQSYCLIRQYDGISTK